MFTVMPIYGTRPEAIKMAPIVRALEQSSVMSAAPVVTGQHREMLAQVNSVFGISPVADLDIMSERQSLNQIASRVLERLDPVISQHEPDAILVQGDTTSAMAGAIAAFNRAIPLVHVEAGLRSGNLLNPFPEEANRKLITQLAKLHLAPTTESRQNLVFEGVSPNDIVVTGNTVIDALFDVLKRMPRAARRQVESLVGGEQPVVLVTAHRRENHGEPMRQIGAAIRLLAEKFPDHTFLLPLHPSPDVREQLRSALGSATNVVMSEPLNFPEMALAISRSILVITDSGGVQEEAPALGKPVLVMRENTERPEGVSAGTARLVGTATKSIVDAASNLLTNQAAYEAMANAVNPYGDGHASERTLGAIAELLGCGTRLPSFAS